MLLENNAPTGFRKCLGRSEDRCSQQWRFNSLGWIRGPECGGPEPVAWGRSPMPLVPVSGGQHDENQRLAGVPAIEQSAGAECGDLRWATEGRGLLRREVRWLASKGGPGGSSRKTGRWLASRGRPVSTWVDGSRSYVAVTYQVAARTGVLPSRASPGGRRLSRSSGATAVRLVGGRSCLESTLGVMRRHADQVCVVDARRRLADEGDLVERLATRE